MSQRTDEDDARAAKVPLGHETLAAGVGLSAAVLFILSPWLVDRSGPDPFYKGPLIFPMIVLAITALSAVPAVFRVLRLRAVRPFHIDGHGFPGRAAFLFILMCLYPPSTLLAVPRGCHRHGPARASRFQNVSRHLVSSALAV